MSDKVTAIWTVFACPLSKKMMEEPVVASDGYTYEHESIRDWLKTNKTSPVTKEELSFWNVLVPNHALKAAFAEIMERRDTTKELVSFMGPITKCFMVDPVVAADGHTYDRTSIEHWFRQRNTSPVTNVQLPHTALLPNLTLKKLMQQMGVVPVNEKVIIAHDTITCDGCNKKPIVGVRYKSYRTKNFDICEECEASGKFVAHEPLYKILDSRLLNRPCTEVTIVTEPIPEPLTLGSPALFTISHSSVTCDGCLVFPIEGPRFKSTVSHDFDLCAPCEASGLYTFCEPFLKITDSRKIKRPGVVNIKNPIEDTNKFLFRILVDAPVCWTPNANDTIPDHDLTAGMLIKSVRRVQGTCNQIFIEVRGELLGLPLSQVYFPEMHNNASVVARVEPTDECLRFVAKRSIAKTPWPVKKPNEILHTKCVKEGEIFHTAAVVFNGDDDAFYQLAESDEWVYINGDSDALLLHED